MTFSEQHPDLGHLIRELALLAKHNVNVRRGRTALPPFYFAQAALTFLALERFLRVILGDSTRHETLRNLLERAMGRRRGLLVTVDRAEEITRFVGMRDDFVHAKLEARARSHGHENAWSYLSEQFLPDLDDAFVSIENLARQIDPECGERRRVYERTTTADVFGTAPTTLDHADPADELNSLRAHNKRFADGRAQDTLLLFAEAANALLLIERVARGALGTDAEAMDFRGVLNAAVLEEGTVVLPWDVQADGVEKIIAVRNTLVHANYEQAAEQAGCASVAAYFGSVFAAECEVLGLVALHLEARRRPAGLHARHCAVSGPDF